MKFSRAILLIAPLAAISVRLPLLYGGDGPNAPADPDRKSAIRSRLKTQSPIVADNFDPAPGAAAALDAERWRELGGAIALEGGKAVCRTTTSPPGGPEGPDPAMVFGGFASRGKMFGPGLAGTNYVEVDLSDCKHEGVSYNARLDMYDMGSAFDDPAAGRFLMRWSLMIGNFTGQIRDAEDDERAKGVQLWCDAWTRQGPVLFVGRRAQEDEKNKYPVWRPGRVPLDEMITKPFIADSCLILAARIFPPETFAPAGHRYGLGLADNGQALFWTLDGEIMDVIDIQGYFDPADETFKEGAYVSIGGESSHAVNEWKYDWAKIYASE